MDKNFGEAGKVLDGFYSGVAAKKESFSPTVSLKTGSRSLAQAEKEVCNAKASIIVLSAKVPPLESGTGKSNSKERGLPSGSGMLAAGGLALALASKKKGYFSNYGEDAHTVWNYITGNDGNSGSSNSNTNSGNSTSTHTVVNVDNSSGTVVTSTGTDNSCPSSSTACNGQAWLNSQLPHY